MEIPITTHLTVLASSGKPKTRLKKILDGIAYIDIHAPAEDGKANRELLKYLEKKTGKPCKLISGSTSRRKIIRFE